MSVDLQVLWEKIKEEKAASAKTLGINGMIGRPRWGAIWTGSWRRQGNQQGVGCFVSRTVLWGRGDSSCRRPGAEQAWLKSSRSCLWLGSEEWQEDWGELCGTLDSPGAPWRGVVSEKGCDLTWRKAHREPQREADNQSQNRRKVTDWQVVLAGAEFIPQLLRRTQSTQWKSARKRGNGYMKQKQGEK